jgi:hypothetical protein
MKKWFLFIVATFMLLIGNASAQGNLPGGYIGRVLNNTPGTWQPYSFTFTAATTGSNYFMLAFRQDPAYWRVDNVKVTATGSSTNLLTNGDMSTGGGLSVNNGQQYIQAPTAWGVAYQNGTYPAAAGTWMGGLWYDGAVGSYDAIYQAVRLTAGLKYTITFDVNGDHMATTTTTGWQIGVYAGSCGNVGLAPTECTLPSNAGFTQIATPGETYTAGCTNNCPVNPDAGPTGPTEQSRSTSDSVSTSNSVGNTTTTNNQYTWGGGTYTITGTSTPTTTTITTTPVTTIFMTDGTTRTETGTPTTTTSITWDYSVTRPVNTPVNPNVGTNKNSVYITQTNAGASNNITANQSGRGNYESLSLGGSNNNVKIGQGYTFSTSGIANESSIVSNYNLLGLTVSGDSNSPTISQLGLSNSIIIATSGNNNTITTSQNGNNNQTYSLINGNGNTSSITQTGNGIIASVNLYGNNNIASVTQVGNNHSTVLSLVNAGGANNVGVVQTGTGDTYSLQQTCTIPTGCSVSVIRNK